MAKVPLRLYVRDIENLIDRGQTEEALAHCKHILQTFPKCIDVYRLLGKSYLESQRYTDAADILQRVLATIPDDFVAHVGMSIIREDEGNLDGSIWHMERAYETQPANTAVQEELRRLYGRRDGLEPPRVRMTRGALVRMYVKGDLYQQAIGELQAALTEEPQRDDLQILLAKMYTQTGRRVEAIEICSRLIAKSPYSFEANRIMTEILPGTSRAEDVQVYRQRIVTLDPYMAYVASGSPVSEVADAAVMVERLDWDSSRKETSQPSWASSLGINMEDKSAQAHELPDWLASLTPYPTNASPEPPPIVFHEDDLSLPAIFGSAAQETRPEPEMTAPTQPAKEPPTVEEAASQLPDWMKEAGWASTDQPVEEVPVSFQESVEAGEALPADIPDWLKSLAPVQPAQEITSDTLNTEGESLNGLDEVLAASLMAKDTSFKAEQAPASDLDEIPAWLTFDEEKPAEAVQPEPQSEPQPEAESAPDWLSEIKEFTPTEADAQPATDSPEVSQIPEAPAWAKATIPVLPGEPIPPAREGSEEGKDTYAWLEELANQHGAEAPTIIARRSERVEKPPTWIHDEEDTAETYIGPEPTDLEWAVELPEDHVPELLETKFAAGTVDDAQPEVERPVYLDESQAALETPVEGDSFPDWLISLAAASISQDEETIPTQVAAPLAEALNLPLMVEEGESEPIAEAGFIPESEQELSAWLPPQDSFQESVPQTASGEPVLTDEISSAWAAEIDKAFGGLEPEEEIKLATSTELPVEEQGFELPDWLKAEIEAQAPVESSTKGEEAAAAGFDISAWIGEDEQVQEAVSDVPVAEALVADMTAEGGEGILEIETGAAEVPGEPTEEIQPADMLPDWLRGLQESPVESLAQEEAAPAVELPDWLRGMAAEEPVAQPEEAVSQPEELPAEMILGDTLQMVVELEPAENLLEETQEIQVVEAETESISAPVDEIPAWLVELQQSESMIAPVESLAPAEPAGEGWVEEFQAASEHQGLEPTEEILPSEEVIAETAAAEILTVELAMQAEPVMQEMLPELPAVEAAPPPVLEESVVEPIAEAPVLPEELPEEELPVSEVEPTVEPYFMEETTAIEAFEAPVEEPVSSEEVLFNRLYAAQTALYGGQMSPALEFYDEVIRSGQLLDESIHDLRDALYRYPVDISIWQTLGDAYLRSNRLQEALDAYTKAEELIR